MLAALGSFFHHPPVYYCLSVSVVALPYRAGQLFIKALIKYLSETEPSVKIGHEIYYPVPSLAAAINKNYEGSSDEYIYPYLEKLKDDGYIISYRFLGTANVKIIKAVYLDFWKEYYIHQILHDIFIPAIVSLIVALITIWAEAILI